MTVGELKEALASLHDNMVIHPSVFGHVDYNNHHLHVHQVRIHFADRSFVVRVLIRAGQMPRTGYQEELLP